MNIDVAPAAAADHARFRLMMHDYLVEMSAILGLVEPVTQYPRLDAYWSEPGAGWAYWLRADGHDAGFALVRRWEVEKRFEIAEFFVARPYRRSGVGLAAARIVIGGHPGRWRITQREANGAAVLFWRRVLCGFVAYEETRTVTDAVRREQRFEISPR